MQNRKEPTKERDNTDSWREGCQVGRLRRQASSHRIEVSRSFVSAENPLWELACLRMA
jgi:hypothetical protein